MLCVIGCPVCALRLDLRVLQVQQNVRRVVWSVWPVPATPTPYQTWELVGGIMSPWCVAVMVRFSGGVCHSVTLSRRSATSRGRTGPMVWQVDRRRCGRKRARRVREGTLEQRRSLQSCRRVSTNHQWLASVRGQGCQAQQVHGSRPLFNIPQYFPHPLTSAPRKISRFPGLVCVGPRNSGFLIPMC